MKRKEDPKSSPSREDAGVALFLFPEVRENYPAVPSSFGAEASAVAGPLLRRSRSRKSSSIGKAIGLHANRKAAAMAFATAMARPASFSFSLSRAFRFRALPQLPARQLLFKGSVREARSSTSSALLGFRHFHPNSVRGRVGWLSSRGERCSGWSECRAVSSSPSPPQKEVAVEVPVIVDEALAGVEDFPVLQAVIEQLEIDAPVAVKLAIAGFEDFDSSDVVELSVMLCDDARIRELNKEWRQKDSPTDVLSFPQDQPAGRECCYCL